MKIALIGYGKMGKMIHHLAEKRNHEIIATINSNQSLEDFSIQDTIKQADVCIDFSNPDILLSNIEILTSLKKNLILGTTGWQKDLSRVEHLVKQSGIGFLYSANFSLGVALFLKVIDQAAHLISSFQQYHAAGLEIHHNQKIDSPSGTAKMIEEKLNLYYPNSPIAFSSVRVGNVPGTHTVYFDSSVDTITLTHDARNREGFAEGALIAAEWINGKNGIFTLNDLLNEKFS